MNRYRIWAAAQWEEQHSGPVAQYIGDATASLSDDGELVAANDRPDYVVSTAEWALMMARQNGGRYGRV